jgi:hypothetical protein
MTNRRKFIGAAAAMVAGTAVASAMPNQKAQTLPSVVHHVFFWLKNPGSKADRDKLIAGLKTLKKIETVRGLHIGTVASTKKRDKVDASWDVSELIFFDNVEGEATYQDHPIHLEFVKNCGPLFEKVIVYDAISI